MRPVKLVYTFRGFCRRLSTTYVMAAIHAKLISTEIMCSKCFEKQISGPERRSRSVLYLFLDEAEVSQGLGSEGPSLLSR